jgi:hypothetical protein
VTHHILLATPVPYSMFAGTSKRGRKYGDVACIFVHAGAGYHSTANEMIHLTACNE